MADAPTIPLAHIHWEAIDGADARHRLLAVIQIGPLNMHLEAWQIDADLDVQGTIERSDAFDQIGTVMECDRFVTLEIDGREYFIIATPYGD